MKLLDTSGACAYGVPRIELCEPSGAVAQVISEAWSAMRSASRDSTRACGIVRVPCRHSRATLRTFETVVQLIGHTRTAAGLRVKATLDTATYPTGVVVTRAQMNASSLHPHDFRGEWNYELRPRRR